MTERAGSPRRRIASLLLGAVLIAACGGGGSKGPSTGGAAAGVAVPANDGISGDMAVRVTSRNHTVGSVPYDLHPPAGGDHNPTPAPCGFYTQEMIDQYNLTDEYVVHTLEHGSVWLAYSPTLPAADVDEIRAFVNANDDLIATPYKGLAPGVAVVVTAWARQLTLTSVGDPRLAAFYRRYRNGSQAPEASIACPRLQP